MSQNDDVTRDPALESALDRVEALAIDDANNDRDPQILTGALAECQTEYDDAYITEMLRLAAAKAAN